MVNVCRDKGEGFVDYMWSKPGDTKPAPKVSFVKLYKPWGWILGSGIYVDDVTAEMASVRNRVLIVTVIGSLVIVFIVFLVSIIITRALKAWSHFRRPYG